jgi:hypothetical protein
VSVVERILGFGHYIEWYINKYIYSLGEFGRELCALTAQTGCLPRQSYWAWLDYN